MTTFFNRLCTTILIVITCAVSNAQDFLVKLDLVTTENGLSGITTYSITQDNERFVWVSTSNGLDRYDGGNFNFYSAYDYQLEEKYIGRMAVDSFGLLWLMNTPDLLDQYTKFPIEKVSVFDTRNQRALPASELNSIRAFFRQDSFYLPKITGWPNRTFFSNEKGALWTYQKNQFQLFQTGFNGAVQSIRNTPDALWMGVGNELLKVSLEGETQRQIKLPGPILDLWLGENETIWVATLKKGKGSELELWEVSPDNTFEPFQLKDASGKPKFLPFNSYIGDHIYRTKAGLWLVNLEYAVHLYAPDGREIMFLNDHYDKYSLAFRDVVESGDALLMATSGGIIRLTIQPNRFKLIHARPYYNNSRTITGGPDGSILFNETFVEHVDSNYQNSKTLFSESSGFSLYYQDSTIWFGNGYNESTIIYEKNLFSEQIANYDFLKGKITLCIQPTDDPNLLWVGGIGGLALLNRQTQQIVLYTKFNGFSDLEKSIVRYIYKNEAGFWLATNFGIFLLDFEKGVLQQFSLESGDLPFNDIAHIHEDKAGVFWLATLGAGMIRWEPGLKNIENAIFQEYNTKTGLSHDIIYSILEDEYQRLWISSNKGLMLFNKKTESLITFLERDGLPDSEFNLTSHYKAKDGKLYFGGLGGIITLNPSEFDSVSHSKAPLVWTRIKVLEKDAREAVEQTKFLAEKKRISFLPQQKFMEFEFKLLDFDHAGNHQYAYKIEGFSNTWNHLATNTFRIAHLPYGKYILRVKGGNITKGWSEEELSLIIEVPKPFYLQVWFFILSALIIMSVSWSLVKIRTRQLRKDQVKLAQKIKERTAQIEADKVTIEQQAQKLQALDQLKSRYFTNITHELRTPLSLILGPANQLVKEENQSLENQNLAKTIYNNAQNLLGLTDELLDLARMEAGTLGLEKSTVNLRAFLQEILDTYQAFAHYQQIKFTHTFTFSKDLFLEIDAKKVEKIIHNLLSNAFKFTSVHGEIQVYGTWEEEELYVEVKDTGRGIDPKVQPFIFDRYVQADHQSNQLGMGGAGIGLAICKEYLQLMDGTIQLESKLEYGTTFMVKIPATKVPGADIKGTVPVKVLLHDIPKNIESSQKKGLVPTKKYRILIAEDNLELALYLQKALLPSYEVQIVQNGLKAWQLLQKECFDLLISDVMMPEMNGLDLLAKLKAHETYQKIPFIMLTALVELEDRIKALRIGVDDYLPKPFLIEELEIRVKNLLDRYENRQEGLAADGTTILSADEHWLQNLEQTAIDTISDPNFTVRQLAEKMNLSERSLFNQLKALVGISPGAYLREVRLNQARLLLEQKKYKTVSEVCYAVGFQKPSYFAQLFKKRFGHLPSRYFK